jgi:ABC-type transporter Mla MlaB component
MTICMEGKVAHLRGDLTYSGMTHGNIDSLVNSLQQIEFGGEKKIRIDCGKIRTADINGLQLLYVWMQCARFAGVEPELFNLPDNLRRIMKKMGVGHCFPVRERTFSGRNTSTILAG